MHDCRSSRVKAMAAVSPVSLNPVGAVVLCLALGGSVHGRTLVVAPGGDDAAPGTSAAPFRTISRAAEAAMPGDTVLVRAGVYRERVAPPRGGTPGKPITYRGEELGTVFIRGSEPWHPRWERHAGSVYSAPLEAALFDDGDVYVDSTNPFLVELASTPYGRDGKPEAERFSRGDARLIYTCGQVIVDGKPWVQRPFREEVETRPGTWAFVHGAAGEPTGTIWVNFGELDPAQHEVEVAARRRIFAPHVRGLGHIVVEGFVLEHCGNQYPTNFWRTPKWAQAGALGLRGGHHWIVRGNIIRYANTIALDMGASGGDNERRSAPVAGAPYGSDNRIERNWFLDNGAAGVVGAGSTRVIIRDNVFLRNNTLRFKGPKRWEHAGIKCHFARDGLIEHNFVADSPDCDGIWLDNQFPGTRVTRNVVIGNGGRGIFLEMSDYRFDAAFVDHNIVIGNRAAQFYVHDASGATIMHNLFANSPPDARYGQGAYIYQVSARTRTGYHSIYNNIFVHHRVMLDIDYPSHRGGPQRLDHNVYDAAAGDRVFLINSASDRPSPWTPEEFLALVRGEVGTDGPQPIDGGAKVAMTLEEWREFWSAHGLQNDRGSVTRPGVKVSCDRASLELTLDVPFDPRSVGSTSHEKMDRDFEGRPLPRDGTALPGPVQTLHEGENRIELWRGPRLLAEGELP